MIITSSKLATLKPDAAIINDGAIVVMRGIIQAIGTYKNVRKRFAKCEVISLPGSLLMPGLVNLHTHLELPPLLDIIRARTFPDWVLNLIAAKKGLTHSDYRRAATQNINSLIQTGTTTVGEICTHGVSPSLLKRSGLRGIVFDEIIRMGPKDLKVKVARSQLRRSHLLSPGISPHSPYTVSESVLRAISSFSQKEHARFAMHIAESRGEIKLLQQKKSGLEKIYEFAKWDPSWAPKSVSAFAYLKKIGFLSPHLIAVHAVQTTDDDIKLLRQSRTSVAHCPRSNKELSVGKMPLRKMLEAGITVGLGTDSLASSPSLNMWDEMRYAYKIHHRDGVSAEDILRLATIGGAKALGMASEIGTLETGKKADLIAVPLPKKNTGDFHADLLKETKSCIMSVIDGRILFH